MGIMQHMLVCGSVKFPNFQISKVVICRAKLWQEGQQCLTVCVLCTDECLF